MSSSWDDLFSEEEKTPVLPLPMAKDLTYVSIQDIKKIPKQELYRLIVDGLYHKDENGWLGYAKREPNCLPACFKALEGSLQDLNHLDLSVDLIKSIHKNVTENVQRLNAHTIPGEFRSSFGGYVLEQRFNFSFISKEGFLQLHKKINEEYYVYGACITSSMPKHNINLLFSETFYQQVGAMVNSPQASGILWESLEGIPPQVVFYRAPNAEYLSKLLIDVCDEYNRSIKNTEEPEEKLKIIADSIQKIEQLHVFPDANGRTSTILLQRLLIQNGFFPAMLYNPNHIDGYSLNELIDEIKKGISNTKTIIEHPEQSIHDYKTERISAIPSLKVFNSPDIISQFYIAEEKLYQSIQSYEPSLILKANK